MFQMEKQLNVKYIHIFKTILGKYHSNSDQGMIY